MTVTIPFNDENLNGMFAVHLHAAKDKIIETVQVSASKFVATDRYTVGEYTHTPDTTKDDSETVLIPAAAALWLTKQTPKSLGVASVTAQQKYDDPSLVIVFTAESVTIKWDGDAGEVLAVTRFTPVAGNFPPVARLFADNPKPAALSVLLSPVHLDKFTKGATRLLGKGQPFEVTVVDSGSNPDKPGPVRILIGERFRGLLQPNLKIR